MVFVLIIYKEQSDLKRARQVSFVSIAVTCRPMAVESVLPATGGTSFAEINC
jgi:hypothetical protein